MFETKTLTQFNSSVKIKTIFIRRKMGRNHDKWLIEAKEKLKYFQDSLRFS